MDSSLENLIKKYLGGVATVEEQIKVETYYASFCNDPKLTSRLTEDELNVLEEKILKKIYAKINIDEEPHELPEASTPKRRVIQILRFAAVLAGLLALAISYKVFVIENKIILSTKYGEIKTYILSDSSRITLNGNSILEYRQWKDGEPREVTLKGEAFFSVKHTSSNQKFIVTIPGKYSVEVLGTEFNITERKNNSRVVLRSGRVKWNQKTAHHLSVIMKPGEMIELKADAGQYTKSYVNTSIYSSWKEKKLVFDNTSLREIVDILRETYGLDVEVKEDFLLKQTFTGSIPNRDLAMLLIGLEKSFDLKIKKRGKHIEILI